MVYKNWTDYAGVNEKGEIVLDFNNKNWSNVSIDDNGLYVELDDFSYEDTEGCLVTIQETWYEDNKGNRVVPDTRTGEFSDMAHVCLLYTASTASR